VTATYSLTLPAARIVVLNARDARTGRRTCRSCTLARVKAYRDRKANQ